MSCSRTQCSVSDESLTSDPAISSLILYPLAKPSSIPRDKGLPPSHSQILCLLCNHSYTAYHNGHIARKPDSVACEKQIGRTACVSTQYDQAFIVGLLESIISKLAAIEITIF